MSEIKKLEFFYIRHGDTAGASSEDRDSCDITLSPLGQKQILLLGERFKGAQFDSILCSPLVRCVQTAAAIARNLQIPTEIEIVTELIEKSSTENYAGCSLDYLSKYYADLKSCPDLIFGTAKGVFKNEDDGDATARALALSAYLQNRFHYGQRVLIVSHGSFANHFIPAMVGVDMGDAILSINTTSVSKIKFTSDGKKRISFQNDFSHLRPLMPNYEFDV